MRSKMKGKTKRQPPHRARRTERRKDPVARLRAELAIQRARLEVLQGMDRITRQARSMEELYDSYLKTILKVTRTRAGAILLRDRLTHQLVFVACREKDRENFSNNACRSARGSRAGWQRPDRPILREMRVFVCDTGEISRAGPRSKREIFSVCR